MSGVHEMVDGVVETYLQAADAEAPGLIEGLYLVGSVALGDFRPHTSDIDYVAVTAQRPDAAGVNALQRVHARLRARWPTPHFDGLYVTWEDLAGEPSLAGRGPYSYEGRFHTRGDRAGDPVMWQTLVRHGVRCRGPETSTLNVRIDRDVLTRWTLNNLDTYWRPLLRHSSRLHPQGAVALTSWGAAWIVLGVPRLHYTLATGEICSKDAAGVYALQTFPERWHRVVNEALRIRRSDRARASASSALVELARDLRPSLYPTPLTRRRDAVAFGEMAVSDAAERFTRSS